MKERKLPINIVIPNRQINKLYNNDKILEQNINKKDTYYFDNLEKISKSEILDISINRKYLYM